MLKQISIVLIIAGLIGAGIYYGKRLNVKSIVVGPNCGETSPMLFKQKQENGVEFISVKGGVQYDSSRNWQELALKARTLNKRIILFYVSTSCAYCKFMKENVFNQVNVGEVINKNFLLVPLQVDETDNDSELQVSWRNDTRKFVEKHHVQGVPNLTICDLNGDVTDQGVGAMDVEKLLTWIQGK
jgi:thioredoxin-related protein